MKTRIAQIIAAIVLSPLVFVALLTFAVGGDAGKMAKVIRVIGGIEQPSTGRPCSSTKRYRDDRGRILVRISFI
jgi:hypothetical protein